MKSIYRLMRPSTAMVLECRLARKLRKRRANDTGRASRKKAVCVYLAVCFYLWSPCNPESENTAWNIKKQMISQQRNDSTDTYMLACAGNNTKWQ